MAESLHDFMKVGIIHFMAYPQCSGGEGPVVETFRALAQDCFFDVVEVTQVKDPAKRACVREIAEQARLDLAFGAQPILLGGKLDLNSPDEAKRQQAVQAVKEGLDQAEAMGCEDAAVLSGPVSDDRDEARDRLVASLKELCAYAKPKGIVVALETFDQVPYGKNCLIGPTCDAVKVSEAVREEYPDFGLLLDLSHLPLQNESAQEAIKAAGPHLVLSLIHI